MAVIRRTRKRRGGNQELLTCVGITNHTHVFSALMEVTLHWGLDGTMNC